MTLEADKDDSVANLSAVNLQWKKTINHKQWIAQQKIDQQLTSIQEKGKHEGLNTWFRGTHDYDNQ